MPTEVHAKGIFPIFQAAREIKKRNNQYWINDQTDDNNSEN